MSMPENQRPKMPNVPEDPVKLRLRYENLTPQQRNEELRSILNFIPNVPEGKINGTNIDIVNLPNAEKRCKSELGPILSERLTTLLDYAKITPRLKEDVVRFFGISYFVLFGLSGEDKEYYGLLLEGNIFEYQEAKEVERKWYRAHLDEVQSVLEYSKEIGSKRDQSWRMESMDKWANKFMEYYEEEV